MTVISDVLDYSKLEAGKMKLECIAYEPRSVLDGALAAVRSSCDEKNLQLTLDCDSDVPFKVMGDPNRLRQILLNLLSNAVKFTSKGGIHVRVSPWKSASKDSTCGSMRKFVVQDTGRGVAEEHRKTIFNQYQQGCVTVARNYGGTGLGLSICKLLIQGMGGTIGLHTQLGRGSSFWFTLPAEIPMECDLIESQLDESERSDAGLQILVAEYNTVNQKLLTSMLKRIGHTADLASNGKEALDMILEKAYDVVLMDIRKFQTDMIW